MVFFANATAENLSSAQLSTKFLLIAELEQSGDLIRQLTQDPRITLGVTESFQSFFSNSKFNNTCWSGILVNYPTYKRFSARDKDLFHSLGQGYPIHFVQKVATGELQGIDPSCLEATHIHDFLNRCIKYEQSRPLRRQQRYELKTIACIQCVAPARWTADSIPETVQYYETTSTLNVSKGGAYILTIRNYCIGDILNVTLPILGDESSIRSEVRWVKNQDTELTEQAGIGVNFLSVSAQQQTSLESLLRG